MQQTPRSASTKAPATVDADIFGWDSDEEVDAEVAARVGGAPALHYWALQDHNLVTVYRNPHWFNETLLPALQEVWKTVEECRASPERLASAMQHRRPARIKSAYQFIDD